MFEQLETHDMTAFVLPEPVQVLRLGERRLGERALWMDERTELNKTENPSTSFAWMQTLWFLIAGALVKGTQ